MCPCELISGCGARSFELKLIDGKRWIFAGLPVNVRTSAQTKETGEMCNIASPRRTPRCSRLLTSAVFLAIVAAATGPALADTRSTSTSDPTRNAISYFRDRVYSLGQWPPDSGYGISYRKTFVPFFAFCTSHRNKSEE